MKYLKTTIALAIIIAIGGFFYAPAVKAAYNLYYLAESSTGVASTTATFLIGGTATTTKTINTDGVQQINYLVAIASSSTAPTLCWQNEYSNNGTDWYNEDATYASTSVHFVTENPQCMVYATTSASNFISRGSDGVTLFIGRNIAVPNIGTAVTRTKFSIVSPGRAMLDVRYTLKNEVVTTK